ncbi:MAG: alpha/beta hydrolase [Chloroflexi bacterium]|nr:alpha/beta hydrolase [Chloroflexota bacterium]
MPFIKISNVTLYYDFFRADITFSPLARPILLLHGFAGTPESDFEAQLPHLRAHYSVVAPHLYGYGRSSQRHAYTTSYYRDDVAYITALLDELNLTKVKVLAFSDGGIVGLLLAALHPQRVESLAVLGAQPTINEQDVAAIRYWLLEKPLSEEWQEQLAQLHGEPYWRSLPSMYVKAQEDLVAAGGILITDEELAAIRCPTLIMHGARDRVVSADYARILHARIPGSELLLFDAGHAAHLRCEQQYTAAIMHFFREGKLHE